MTDATTPKSDDLNVVWVRETRAGLYQVDVEAAGLHFLADEPRALGGLGSGPNPYDLLCAALGTCTVMTLRFYARRKAWPVDRIAARVSHTRAHLEARDAFTRQVTVTGELSDEQRAKLAEIANRCPVHLTLERGADVITRFVDAPVSDETQAMATDHLRDMREACGPEGRG